VLLDLRDDGTYRRGERMHEEDGSAMSKEKILRYSSGVASRKLQRRTGKQYFGIPIEQVECAANLPPTSGLNIRDMELLLHWCSST
jgi:hypothetical protein